MKQIITEAEFRRKTEKSPSGGYLFFGEEDYLKTHAVKQARGAACPDTALAVFNDMTVDFSTTVFSADAVFSAIAAAPMMAETKAVTVTGLSVDELKPAELDALCDALSSLEEFDFNLFILVAAAGTLDPGYLPKRPSAALAKLGEKLTPVKFDRVPDAKLSSWTVRHFAHNGVKAESGVPAAMLERCGRDMFTLANEVDKLSFYALSKGRDAVSLEDVEEVSSISEEFDSFAFGNAVAEGDTEQALRILALMKARKLEPVIALGEITKTFSDMLAVKLLTAAGIAPADIAPMTKLHEYKVKLYQKNVADISESRLRQAVEMCESADLALKQSPTGYVEIEKLICCTVEK